MMKFSYSILLVLVIFSANVLAGPPETVPAPARDVTVVNTPLPVTGELEADVTIVNDDSSPVPVVGVIEGEVTVVNDDSSPVPVVGDIEGEVTVVNDESMPVPVTGTMELSGIPAVSIVDYRRPFNATVLCEPPSCGDYTILYVPDGQMCVVEYFSCLTAARNPGPEGLSLVCQIATFVNGTGASHAIDSTRPTTVPAIVATGEAVKIYAEGPSPIWVDGYLSGQGDPIDFPQIHVTISGYCIDT